MFSQTPVMVIFVDNIAPIACMEISSFHEIILTKIFQDAIAQIIIFRALMLGCGAPGS